MRVAEMTKDVCEWIVCVCMCARACVRLQQAPFNPHSPDSERAAPSRNRLDDVKVKPSGPGSCFTLRIQVIHSHPSEIYFYVWLVWVWEELHRALVQPYMESHSLIQPQKTVENTDFFLNLDDEVLFSSNKMKVMCFILLCAANALINVWRHLHSLISDHQDKTR